MLLLREQGPGCGVEMVQSELAASPTYIHTIRVGQSLVSGTLLPQPRYIISLMRPSLLVASMLPGLVDSIPSCLPCLPALHLPLPLCTSRGTGDGGGT